MEPTPSEFSKLYLYVCVFDKNNYFLEGVGRGKSEMDNMLIQHSFMKLSKINVKLLPRCTPTNIHSFRGVSPISNLVNDTSCCPTGKSYRTHAVESGFQTAAWVPPAGTF